MKRPVRAKTRILLSEFSSKFGSEILNVRIYRDRKAFVCERELVERDGTSFTIVLPFEEPHTVRAVLASDPYYPKVQAQVQRVLATLDKAVRKNHGKRVN